MARHIADKEGWFFVDKVDKIWLTMENPEQIIKIDKALQKCTELLIENFVESSDEENPYRDPFELEEDWQDQLEAVFMESEYSGTEVFSVGDAFEDVIFRIAEFNDLAVVRIFYPVLFYTLVLKNFDKQNTANRRVQRGSKTWGNTRNLLEVPDACEKNSTELLNAEIRKRISKQREQLLNLIQEKEVEFSRLSKEPVSGDGSHQLIQLEEAEDLRAHAKRALSLLDIRKICWMKVVAQRGSFARDILLSQKAHSKPVDTILRMYLLEAVDGLLYNAERLSNGHRHPDLPREYLVTSWIENEGGNAKSPGKKETSLHAGEEIKGDFEWIYSQLSNSEIREDHVIDMIDYYFSESRLDWFLHCEEHIVKYAGAVIHALQHSQGIDIRYLDLDQLNTPERTKLFDGWGE